MLLKLPNKNISKIKQEFTKALLDLTKWIGGSIWPKIRNQSHPKRLEWVSVSFLFWCWRFQFNIIFLTRMEVNAYCGENIPKIYNHKFLASVISRNQNAHSLVKGTTSFIKTYLTPSSITKNLNNINNILENYLQELEQTKQMTKKKKRTVHSACRFMKAYGS